MKCAVFGCTEGYKKTAAERSLFTFPTDPTVARQWMQFCRQGKDFNFKNCCICMKHFVGADFENSVQFGMGLAKKRILIRGAVPSIYKPGERNPERSERVQRREYKKIVAELLRKTLSSHEAAEFVSDVANEDLENNKTDSEVLNIPKKKILQVKSNKMSQLSQSSPPRKDDDMHTPLVSPRQIKPEPPEEIVIKQEVNTDQENLASATMGPPEPVAASATENNRGLIGETEHHNEDRNACHSPSGFQTSMEAMTHTSTNIEQNGALLPPPSTTTVPHSRAADSTIYDQINCITDGSATPMRYEASSSQQNANLTEDADAEMEEIPDNFFDDLLQNADEISKAIMSPIAAEPPMPSEISVVKDEPADIGEDIPADFFDDMLVNKIALRVEEAANKDIEEKYSTRLKELERLKEEENSNKKKKKKEKKSPKQSSKDMERKENKTRKRFRHTSSESDTESNAADLKRSNIVPTRLRVRPDLGILPMAFAGDSIDLPLRAEEIELLRRCKRPDGLIVDSAEPLCFKRIKLEETKAETPTPPLDRQAKRDRVCNKVIAAIEEFKKARELADKTPKELGYSNTVYKLPITSSNRPLYIYEFRSPLHPVTSVTFGFNTYETRYTLDEWGIKAVPGVAADVLKVLSYDAEILSEKKSTIKLPANLQKLKETTKEVNSEVGATTSFRTESGTQTDEVRILDANHDNGYNIGVQATPCTNSIASQTKQTGTNSADSYQDLPFLKALRFLNENELMAVGDFIELLREPKDETVIDVYRIRQRLVEIHNLALMPSVINANEPTAIPRISPSTPSPHTSSQLAHYQHPAPTMLTPPSTINYANVPSYHSGAQAYVEQPTAVYASNQQHMPYPVQPSNIIGPVQMLRPGERYGIEQQRISHSVRPPIGRQQMSMYERRQHVTHADDPSSTIPTIITSDPRYYGRGKLRR